MISIGMLRVPMLISFQESIEVITLCNEYLKYCEVHENLSKSRFYMI